MSGFLVSRTTSVMPVSGLIVRIAVQVVPPSVVLYSPRSPPEDHSGPCDATYTVFGLRGSIAMRPMCSDVARPMRFHVFPPSADL